MKTLCPHCQTLFRITNEQLKIHSGQVRCGNCKKLFNAFDALSQVEIDAINDEVSSEVSKKVSQENNEEINLNFAQQIDEVNLKEANKNRQSKKKSPSKSQSKNKVQQNSNNNDDDDELKRIEKSLAEIDLLLNDDNQESQQSLDTTETKNTKNTANIKNTKNNPQVIYNYNEITTPESEKFALPSWFNIAIISVLSLFLVLQIFVHFRNNIVNNFPAFRSVYNALNLSLVSNTKNIEQITIEASDLNNVDNVNVSSNNSANKTILKLKIMLGNRATFNQNWPLIELNLTDTLDQSVAKYTFAPQDYLDYLIYQNVAKELESSNTNTNTNNNDLKAKYQQEELLYRKYKQKLKYFQAHSEQTIELYIETDNINAAGYKLAVGYL